MKKLKYLFLLMLCLLTITSCKNKNNDDECKHKNTTWIIDVEATCTTKGSKHEECTDCKQLIKIESIDLLDHNYSPDWSYNESNHYHECDCGKTSDEESHTFVWIIDVEATKESKGLKHQECEVCNYKRNENTTIEVLGHEHNIEHIEYKKETCTTNGNIEYYFCTKCEKYFLDSELNDETTYNDLIIKAYHELVHHDAKTPTCTESGYEAYDKCKNCDYSTYKEIDALGHNYVNDECTRCHNKMEASNLVYKLTKTGYWVTGVKEETTKITVPSTYNNVQVVGIEKNAFKNCNIVEEIEIADNVIYIIDDFSSCGNLRKLSLPANYSLSIDNNELKEIIFTSDIGLENLESIANFGIIINAENTEKLILLDNLILSQRFYANISSNAYNEYNNGYYLGTINNPYCELVSGTDTSISSIDINPNTKIISYYAFRGCNSLTSIEIPNSVTRIGYEAFSNCSSLENVYYEGTIEDWCNITFLYDTSNPMYYANHFYVKNSNGEYEEVTEIEIPNTVTSIGNYQFYEFNNITKITIPNSVTSIGRYAFYYCTSLTSIEIPNSVTSIGSYAFRSCTSLTNIEIPNSVTSIGECAFDCCDFENVTMPNSVETIGRNIFIEGHVGNLYYDGTFEELCFLYSNSYEVKNVDYIYVKDNNGQYYDILELTNPEIPSNVTTISLGLIRLLGRVNDITSIVIPNSVTSIGSSAFHNCSSLTSIEIPNSVTNIGSSAFSFCSSLTSIEIPNSVTNIGSSAFSFCSSLTSIEIPNSVTSIGSYVFYHCSSLTSIEIPNSVTNIGSSAFSGCSSLENVYYNGTIEDWCNIKFINEYSNPMSKANRFYIKNSNGQYEEVTEIEIPNTITKIGKYQFYGFNIVTKVTLPTSVTGIRYSAFSGCSSLTSIEIPNSVASIEHSAFEGCTNLTSIYLPNSVTSIGLYAFSGCTSLTIYCEASSKPLNWDSKWNSSNRPVIWNYKN